MLTLNSPGAVSPPKAAKHACTGKSSPKRKVQGVLGLRLGCKPFPTATKIYLEEIKGSIKESTWKETRKKLNFIGKVLDDLNTKGEVKTLDPRHIDYRDILTFKGWMTRENYDPGTQKKWLTELKKFLLHFDNYVFEELKRKGFKMPRETEKPIRTFREKDLHTILDATDRVKNEWHGRMIRGAFALYWATMRRPSEIRLCRIQDLDLERLTLRIEFPKGGGSWAAPSDVTILRDDMVPYIRQYLKDRERHLREYGKTSIMLFPNLCPNAPEGRYSLSKFNEIKREVEQQAGVRFQIKDFRSSSATDALDRDPRALPMISTQMGHKHEATTQDHYARIKQGRAGEELRKLLNPAPAAPLPTQGTAMPGPMSQAISAKTPVIRSKFEMTGYN